MKNIMKFLLAMLPVIGLFISGSAFGQASITATPDTLCFGCVVYSTSSPSQTSLVSGSYLSPSSGTLTVTAPSNYAVYDPGSGAWVASYTIAYSGGFLPPTPIGVMFNGPATAGSYNGNVGITGGGTSRNIYVTATAVSSISGSCMCTGTPYPGNVVATDTSGCTAYATTLTLNGFCMGAGISFQWQSASSSGGTWTNISGATNSSFNATVTSSMYLKCVVTCSAGGGASTSPIHLAIATPPSVYPIVGASTVAVSNTIPLADATTGGTWSSSNVAIATVNPSGSVYGASTGSAIISYSVTDTCGTTVVTKTITVSGSLSENNIPGVSNGLIAVLSPNPAHGILSITCTLNGAANLQMRVLDLTGQILNSGEVYVNQSGSLKLDLSNLAKGVYLVEITGNGEKLVKMLVKD